MKFEVLLKSSPEPIEIEADMLGYPEGPYLTLRNKDNKERKRWVSKGIWPFTREVEETYEYEGAVIVAVFPREEVVYIKEIMP